MLFTDDSLVICCSYWVHSLSMFLAILSVAIAKHDTCVAVLLRNLGLCVAPPVYQDFWVVYGCLSLVWMCTCKSVTENAQCPYLFCD